MQQIKAGDIVRVKGGTTWLTVRKVIGALAIIEYTAPGMKATRLIEIDVLERVVINGVVDPAEQTDSAQSVELLWTP